MAKVFFQPPGQGWQSMVQTPYTDPIVHKEFTDEFVLSHFDGYINPEGDFYGTRVTGTKDYNGVNDCHNYFAHDYLTKKYGTSYAIKSKVPLGNGCDMDRLGMYQAKEMLVLSEGWLTLTFAVAGFGWLSKSIETRDVFGPEDHEPTAQQIETLQMILNLRNIDGNTLTGNVRL